LLYFLFFVILFFLWLFAYAKYLEKKTVFFPEKEILINPQEAGLSYEDVFIETSDNIKLNGWYIPYEGAAKTLLFFHGNAGNISYRLDKAMVIRSTKVNVFAIDYRGFGQSQGRATEKGLYLDAQAAYNYLRIQRKIKEEDIIIYGSSLGGAVAVDLASKEKVSALILEGVFSTAKDFAARRYPYLPSFAFSYKFDSVSKIKKINVPKLFLHSLDDEVLDIKMAIKLFNAAPEPKKFVKLKGQHATTYNESKKEYLEALSSFIEDLKGDRK
jgi:hypothetical protein